MTLQLDFFSSFEFFQLEGISQDVLLLFLVFAILLFSISILSWCLQKRNVHPALIATIQTVRENLPDERENRPPIHAEAHTCPICMNTPVVLPIETNCGHVFCSQCFSLYLEHTRSIHASQCPLCRSRVSLLMLLLPREAYQEFPDILRRIDYYNRKFSGEPRTLMEYLYDTPTLIRHLIYAFFSPTTLHLTFLSRVVFAILGMIIYLVSPLDIVPDTLGLFGFIDDIIIILSLVCFVGNMYREYLIQRMYNDVH